MTKLLCLLLGVAACGNSAPAETVCRCTPANAPRTKLPDGTPMDGSALLGQLRRHRQMVDQQRNPRDVKMLDDELRFAVVSFCNPCGDWVSDRMTLDEMFPLQRLDEASSAVCMGLVLRDGTTAYGSARPPACR